MHHSLMRSVTLCFAVAWAFFPLSQDVLASPESETPPSLPGERNNDSGRPDRPTPVVSTGVDDGVVTVGVSGPGSNDSGNDRPARSGPPTVGAPCTWSPLRGSDTTSPDGGSPLPGGGTQATDSQGRLGWTVICPGQPVEVRWTTPAVDPATLIQPAVDRARARLPLPTPIQSPAPDVGSVVNLGLWFSIEDPGVTSARATAAGVWAEATGTFVGVTIDPGDESPIIECDGFGEPYPDGTNDPDEGPCGYTYLQPTPDGEPYIVTYTITYDITWRTSDGRSGSVGAFDRDFSFPFDVNEIQIVGTGRN